MIRIIIIILLVGYTAIPKSEASYSCNEQEIIYDFVVDAVSHIEKKVDYISPLIDLPPRKPK